MAMRMVEAWWPEPVSQKPIEQEFSSFDAKVVAGITPFCSASPHSTLRHENFNLAVIGWDCRDHGYDPISSASPLAGMGSCGCHSRGRVAGCGTWQSVRLFCGDRLRVRLLWVPESFLAAIQRPNGLTARQYSWSTIRIPNTTTGDPPPDSPSWEPIWSTEPSSDPSRVYCVSQAARI